MIDSPNHNKEWEPMDEMHLMDRFDAGCPLETLCSEFGRRPNAIITRLVKLDCLVEIGHGYRVVKSEYWADFEDIKNLAMEYEP